MRIGKWALIPAALVSVALVVASIGVHVQRGASLPVAFQMSRQDLAVVATCPTRVSEIWTYVERDVYQGPYFGLSRQITIRIVCGAEVS